MIILVNWAKGMCSVQSSGVMEVVDETGEVEG